MWIAGIRRGILYKVNERPVDPRWSNGQLQNALALCATGMHLGWSETRAFQAAEAIVASSLCPGIVWGSLDLIQDIRTLESTCLEGTS